MQQTEKYKLNLIESSDPFLPDALNANTQRLEEVVSGHLEGMDQRVTVLEAKQFAYGSFRCLSGTMDIPLPFAPIAVLLVENEIAAFMNVKGAGNNQAVRLGENGFQAVSLDHGADFTYIAFG